MGYRAACALIVGFVGFLTPVSVADTPDKHDLRITVRPRVVAPYDWATITVVGAADASSVAVRLQGASGVTGQLLPWLALDRHGEDWTVRLSQPVLAGIYPIEIRTRPDRVVPATATYLRMYWPDTGTLLFATPEQVADSWVRDVVGGTLDAIRRWPRTAIDHRLPALHRLFVVAYSLPGKPARADRLGVWITAVREGFRGRWRLLEASASPP